ncbi:MAG: adenosylcobinamide-GDP ribazoletransferase [Desulfobacteraceae bacterium]|nr:adenosylcobinamide-GDP ribazoletransferase [Desulfobacteraceae bacterium]
MTQISAFMRDLRSAIMFITILPAGKGKEFSATGMIRFFPVVGMILGALLVVADQAASMFWTAPVVALLDVLFLVAVTGAFHLDGLGDAADGLFSHRSRERALEIMKDSRTGMMGLVAIFCMLALKVAGIYAVKTGCTPFSTILILFIVPALSRAGMLFGIRFLNYGRKNTGTGHDLFEKPLPFRDFASLFLLVILAFLLGVKGVVLLLVFGVTVFLILGFYKIKMGCITGDMLGAMTEVTEAVLFLTAGATLL